MAQVRDEGGRAESRIQALLTRTDTADPTLVVALPALWIDRVVALNALPPQRSLEDCVVLAHAYGQLGVHAEVRAVTLGVTHGHTGRTWAFGEEQPRWEAGRLRGHTVVWLPATGHLVDVTAEQFPPLAARRGGPVIAVAPTDGDEPRTVTADRDHLALAYHLAPPPVTSELLADPGEGYRRGVNVAAEVVRLLAAALPPGGENRIPFPRTAALITLVRQLDTVVAADGSRLFQKAGRQLDLTQIPLPDGVPPAIPYVPSGG
jgi:hypothetical protein